MVGSGFSFSRGASGRNRRLGPCGSSRGARLGLWGGFRRYHPPRSAPGPPPCSPSFAGSRPVSPNSIRLVLSSVRAAKIAGIPTLASPTQTLVPPSPCAADIAASPAGLSTASPSCAAALRSRPTLLPAGSPVLAPQTLGSYASLAPGNSSRPYTPRPPAPVAACVPCFSSPDPPEAPATHCPPHSAPPVAPRSTDCLPPPPPARCSTARNSVSTS